MSKTHVNLQMVIEFNNDIQDFSKNLKRCFNETENTINKLSQEWRDEHFTEFQKNFKKYSDQLQPLSAELDKYEKHIETYWIPRIEEIKAMYNK